MSSAMPRLRADAHALDAELLRERLRAGRDRVPQLVRLEQDGLAAEGEHLALEPLVAADRQVADGASVGKRPRPALDRPAGDRLVVEHLRGARVAEPRRFEAF